jgi:DNA repair exonuclease SbcCD ATPase subunit
LSRPDDRWHDCFEETTAILNQTKSPFWSLGGRRRDRDETDEPTDVQTAPEVSSKLGSLMQQLDAGIAQSTERERATQAGRRREIHAVTDPAPADSAPVAEPAAAAAPAETPKVELGVIEPTPEPEALEVDPATSEALRLIADQRKAAEALLSETRALEDQIKNAAVAAQATRAYQAAKTKAENAMAKAEAAASAEAEAKQRADVLVRDHSVLSSELKSIEQAVASKRREADAAKAEIAELERKLSEKQNATQTIFSDLALHESRARECSARETAAARSAAEAAARAAARKAEREAAEASVQAASERAEVLKAALPAAAQEAGAIEDLQRLTARITEQVQLARSLRNGRLNGQKAS